MLCSLLPASVVELPSEVLSIIFEFLSLSRDLLPTVSLVCRTFSDVIFSSPNVWKLEYERSLGPYRTFLRSESDDINIIASTAALDSSYIRSLGALPSLFIPEEELASCHRSVSLVSVYHRFLRRIYSLRMLVWGQRHRAVLGIEEPLTETTETEPEPAEPEEPEEPAEEPEEPEGEAEPKTEIEKEREVPVLVPTCVTCVRFPWFIPRTHEYFGGCIALDGSLWTWGELPPFADPIRHPQMTSFFESSDSDDEDELGKILSTVIPFRIGCDEARHRVWVPHCCEIMNEYLRSQGEIPIYFGSGHNLGVLQTHVGNVYVWTANDAIRRIEHHCPIRVVATFSFSVVFLDAEGQIYNVRCCYRKARARLLIEKYLADENDAVLDIVSGNRGIFLFTSSNSVLFARGLPRFGSDDEFDPLLSRIDVPGQIVVAAVGCSTSHLVLLSDGRVFSHGTDYYGELSGTQDKEPERDESLWLEMPGVRETVNSQGLRVIGVATGVDWHNGGFSLLLAEPLSESESPEQQGVFAGGKVLFHCGSNKRCERLELPDQWRDTRHGLQKLRSPEFDGRVLLMYRANENYCAVLVCGDGDDS